MVLHCMQFGTLTNAQSKLTEIANRLVQNTVKPKDVVTVIQENSPLGSNPNTTTSSLFVHHPCDDNEISM